MSLPRSRLSGEVSQASGIMQQPGALLDSSSDEELPSSSSSEDCGEDWASQVPPKERRREDDRRGAQTMPTRPVPLPPADTSERKDDQDGIVDLSDLGSSESSGRLSAGSADGAGEGLGTAAPASTPITTAPRREHASNPSMGKSSTTSSKRGSRRGVDSRKKHVDGGAAVRMERTGEDFSLRKWRTNVISDFQQLIDESEDGACSSFEIVSCIAAIQKCSRPHAVEYAKLLLKSGDLYFVEDNRERRRTEAKIQLPQMAGMEEGMVDKGTRRAGQINPADLMKGAQAVDGFEDSDRLRYSFNPKFVATPRRRLQSLEKSMEKAAQRLGQSATKTELLASPKGRAKLSQRSNSGLATAEDLDEDAQLSLLDLSCGRCQSASSFKCQQCDIALCLQCSDTIHAGKWKSHELEPVLQTTAEVNELRTMPTLVKTLRLMEAPRGGVKVRSKRVGIRRYRRVFSGEDMIDWVVKHLPIRNRGEGIELGQQLVAASHIESVGSDEAFADSKSALFRFCKGRTLRKKRASGVPEEHADWNSTLRQKVTLKDFELVKLLGKGGFGKVLEVRRKTDGKTFAMKIIRKSLVSRSAKRLADVAHERAIMQNDHPFLVHMHYAFQTEDKIFFVIDYLAGGDLWYHLAEAKNGLPAETVKFLVAEMILALEYLHGKNIVYRDLKPENVLVDEDGHICLTDFGISKQLQSDADRTHSIVGTTCFMAPEVIRGEDYGVKCDWWSLGVMIYHLLSGRHPFFAQDKAATIEKVLHKPVIQPPNLQSDVGFDLIKHMLDRDPSTRWAHADIKNHEFFETIDWDKLALKKLQPPFGICVDGPHELWKSEEGSAAPLMTVLDDDATDAADMDELYFPRFVIF